MLERAFKNKDKVKEMVRTKRTFLNFELDIQKFEVNKALQSTYFPHFLTYFLSLFLTHYVLHMRYNDADQVLDWQKIANGGG